MKKINLQLFAEPELPKNPITPEINYETEAFINTTPSEEKPKWASMAELMTNMFCNSSPITQIKDGGLQR